MHPKIIPLHKQLSSARLNDSRFTLTDEDCALLNCTSSWSPPTSKEEVETILRFTNTPALRDQVIMCADRCVRQLKTGLINPGYCGGTLVLPLGYSIDHPYEQAIIQFGTDKIIFSETLIHASMGKYKTVKVHKFLATHTDMSEVTIRDICNILKGVGVVKFACTREEILHVYLNGPKSCMSKPIDFFDLEGYTHPVEAYATGEIAIAYLEDKHGNILARTVCVPGQLEYVQVYGHPVLDTLLADMGYTEDQHTLLDHTLLTLENSRGIRILPYLDGSLLYCATDCISMDGASVDYRTGTLEEVETCYNCSAVVSTTAATQDRDGDYFCDCCATLYICPECNTYHALRSDTENCCNRLPF